MTFKPITASEAASGIRESLAPGRLGTRAALALVASAIIVFLAASSAPSPLYGLYREMWGFSPLLLTVIFSVYALGLIAALLVLGALSDHVGRRVVIVGAMLAEIVAVVLFWQAQSAGWLIAARLVQGLATGAATSALSAMLLDLSPKRGALFNALAPMIGMALGALGAAALVQYAPAPTQLVYVLILGALVLQTLLALRLPDTVTPRAGGWRSLLPRLHVPAAARPVMLRLLPLCLAGWALGGFYLSLGPTLARLVTGQNTPLVGGAFIATLVLSGAVAIHRSRAHEAQTVLRRSALWLATGLLLTLAGVHWQVTALLFGGTLVAGQGFGAGFAAAVRCLVPTAHAHERAGLLSTFYMLNYLAFSLPAIAAGMAVGRFGLLHTTLGYGLALAALALCSRILMPRPAA